MALSYMIASDIHGDAESVEALLRRFDAERETVRMAGGDIRLLLLGDLLYHGPRNPLPGRYSPKETAAKLNARKADLFCVRGNCDAEVDQMMLEFPILSEYALVTVGNRLLFATHGHHYKRDSLPPLREGDLFLFGHTHIPMVEWDENTGILCLNPGSVSLPKGGSERGYFLLTPSPREKLYHKALDGRLLGEYDLAGQKNGMPGVI